MRNRCRLVPLAATLASCGGGEPPPPGPVLLPFAHHVIDAAPPGGPDCCTDVLASGDLDGDGRTDLVVGSEKADGDGLVWYRGPTWQRRGIASGQFTTDAAVADIDGDGFDDVIACDHGRGIFWYRSPGDAIDGPWHEEPIGEGYAHDLLVADFGRDSIDVVSCDKQRVTLWRRDGSTWNAEILLERPGEGIDTADVDGDGLTDLCFGGSWLRNPGTETGAWEENLVAPGWPADTRVRAADLDADGDTDVVLAASEGPGHLAWFENDQGRWTEHPLWDDDLRGVHSLRITDLDLDGDLDVVAAEMHTSPQRRVAVCYQDAPDRWRPVVLADTGSHNLLVADLDADGDPDLVGKNYGGAGRRLEVWENLVLAPRHWTYVAIDRGRPEDQFGATGCCFVDFDRDGKIDVIAGSFAYHNPGGDLAGTWTRERLPGRFDAHFGLDVDRDQHADLVGFDGRNLVWAEREGGTWRVHTLAELPQGRTQGSAVAALIDGGRDELLFTRGKRLFFVTLPGEPATDRWDVVQLTDSCEEEGIAVGDFDGDGDLDVFAQDEDGHSTVCYLNPGGDGRAAWPRRSLARSKEWLDRLALADLDGDGRPEVITTEETQDWGFNASVYLLRAPTAGDGPWRATAIARLRSVNSLDVGDVDLDGDLDLVIAEHTDQRRAEGAPDTMTVALLNNGTGLRWDTEWIDVGPRSSHLGAQLCDLDGDGDLDLVSIAWRQFATLHLWRNDRRR